MLVDGNAKAILTTSIRHSHSEVALLPIFRRAQGLNRGGLPKPWYVRLNQTSFDLIRKPVSLWYRMCDSHECLATQWSHLIIYHWFIKHVGWKVRPGNCSVMYASARYLHWGCFFLVPVNADRFAARQHPNFMLSLTRGEIRKIRLKIIWCFQC